MSLFLFSDTAAAEAKASYLYNLSNFTGVIPFTWVRVVSDPIRNEVYVCSGGSVHVFNASGMEIYRFGDDELLGYPYDVATLENGDILLLSNFPGSSVPALVRCDYRGDFIERRSLTGIPGEWGVFRPTRMVLRGEKLYAADYSGMKAAVLDKSGSLLDSFDLSKELKVSERKAADFTLGGFDADDQGNLYFTVATQFKVYRLSGDRRLESFGAAGSIPGKFGIVAGVAADRSGTIYVVDTLKCVVMAFDQEFNFLHEFGYRTPKPGGLVAPKDATVSGDGMLYVTQQGERGVNVYRVSPN
jgi:hypothetical protein